MSTALRLTSDPPLIRLIPWLPTYDTSREVDQGSAICTPVCHCQDAGTAASYWKIESCGTPSVLSPDPSVASCPLRRSCAVAIGGLPGIEKMVFPSGRSKKRPPPPRRTTLCVP